MTRRRNRCDHIASGGIDLVDARLRDLVKVLAVKGGAGIARTYSRTISAARAGGSDTFLPVSYFICVIRCVIAYSWWRSSDWRRMTKLLERERSGE